MAHIPERMCVGCRKMFNKSELLRLVRTDSGIIADEGQKVQSRGVYVCRSEACITAAKKKKALQRQFKENVPEAVYDKLLYSVGE